MFDIDLFYGICELVAVVISFALLCVCSALACVSFGVENEHIAHARAAQRNNSTSVERSLPDIKMKLIPLIVGALAVSSSDALKVRAGMWGPADLELVDTSLQHILSLHMTPAMHKRVEVVAADVKSDIAAVSLAHNMTKQQRQAKVGAAIKELVEFQAEMQNETADYKKKFEEKNAHIFSFFLRNAV